MVLYQARLYLTNRVAFQEKETLQQIPAKPRDKKRPLLVERKSIEITMINPKQESSTFNTSNVKHGMKQEVKTADKTVLMWSVLRILASQDQTLLILSGWLSFMRQKYTSLILHV